MSSIHIYITIVCLLHLLTVESAPSPLNNNRITATSVGLNGLKVPILANRFNLDDKRQNWGILINGSLYDEKVDASNGYRPITIPRLSTDRTLLPAENIAPEVKINFKPKRFLKSTPEVNEVSKVANNGASKVALACDVARIKCCFDKSDLDNCSKASECLRLEVTSADLCNPRTLQESIRKVLNLF